MKFSSQLFQGSYAPTHRRLNLPIQHVEIVVGRNAHFQASEAPSQVGAVIRYGHRHRARIQGIVASNNLKDQGTVGHGPSHRADVVAVKAGYQQPPLADSSKTLLEPHDSAEGPRQTN